MHANCPVAPLFVPQIPGREGLRAAVAVGAVGGDA